MEFKLRGSTRLRFVWRGGAVMVVCLALAGCTGMAIPGTAPVPYARTAGLAPTSARFEDQSAVPVGPTRLDALVVKYSNLYGVPESLVRRIIVRESRYNPRARNGPYWGLMQIRYDTAQSMGYTGPASGLLDAETNLKYGVKYLAGAYLVGNNNEDQAVRNYASGYYYRAKAKGLLVEVGLD